MLPNSDRYPVQVGLSTLLSSTQAFNPSSAGSSSIQLPTLALATILWPGCHVQHRSASRRGMTAAHEG
jgi:hypothetical protein